MNTQTKLGEIITQIRGVSYKPSDVRAAGDPDAVALLRANNIQEDGLNFDDLVWVDKQKVGAEQYLRLGDILICSSSGSKGLVGKAAIVTSDLSCAFGAFCKVVRTKAEYASYLGQFFRSPRYRKEISASAAGANINNIRNEHIDEMFISMPSANERAGCVAKLGQIDYLIQKTNNQSHQLDQIVKSRFVEMFGEPIANTHSLPLISLSEVGSWNSGGTPSRSNPAYFEGDIDWYSAGELNTLYLEGSVEKITQDALENSTAKLFPAGSMLVGMYDTAAFKMGILKWSSASNQACACIEPNNSIDIVWLYHVLQIMKPHFLEQRRGIRQKNLNLGMIKSFQIPCASKPEQNRFAAFVTEVDKSKLAVKQSLEKLETLKKSLMQQYFGV